MADSDYLIIKAFVGHADFLDKIQRYNGSPHGALTADFKGQICFDYTNNNFYINNAAATTWTLINY